MGLRASDATPVVTALKITLLGEFHNEGFIPVIWDGLLFPDISKEVCENLA